MSRLQSITRVGGLIFLSAILVLTACNGGGGPGLPAPGLSPSIEPATAPPATVGLPYNLSFRWTTNVAKPPFFWNLNGSMPPGTQFDPPNGRLYGTPTTPGSYSFEMVVRDSNSPQRQESRNYSIVVGSPTPPTILDPLPGALPRAKVGIPYRLEIHVRGGVPPYTCSVNGYLPPGITLDPNACELSGTATATGNFSFVLFVFDSQNPPAQVSAAYGLSVIDPIQLLTTDLPDGFVGQPYGPEQLLAKGGQPCPGPDPYIWAFESGYFPAGLSINPATGMVSGIPTASGFYDFLVRVTDCDNPAETTTQDVKIRIQGPLTITNSAFPFCKKGVSYSAEIHVEGGVPPYSWSLDGQLAPGLTYDIHTGHITGTATATGRFSFSATVTDSDSPPNTAIQPYTLVCIDPIQITTASLPDGVTTFPYSAQVQAKGGWPQCGGAGPESYNWATPSGFLPPGVSIGPTTGTFTGIPAAAGTYDFLVRVQDCDLDVPPLGETATRNLSISIYDLLTITSPLSLPPPTVGVPYFFQLTSTGGKPPISWSADSGSMPPGLTLSPSGLISGTPTVGGAFKLNVRATDSSSPPQTVAQDPIILVNEFHVVTPTLTVGEQGVAYTSNVDILGGTPNYCWTLASGTLPPNITAAATTLFNPPNLASNYPVLTYILSSAIPLTVADVGTWNVRLQFRDNGDGDLTPCETNGQDRIIYKDYILTVVPPPAITTSSLPDAFVGVGYSQQLTEAGGIGPFIWQIVNGSPLPAGCTVGGPLPPELTLSTNGLLSGTPRIADTTGYPLCVQVTDSNGMTDYQQLLLRVLQDIALCVDGLNGGDATGDGTTARPFKTLNRALSYTSANNLDLSGTLPRIGAIRVAGSTFGGPLVYHENIRLSTVTGTDVDLLGGWTGFPGDFCNTRGGVPNARIKGLSSNALPTVITEGLTRSTWIELLEIDGNDATNSASVAIYNNFFFTGSSPTIARNTIRGGNSSGAGAISYGIFNQGSGSALTPTSPLIVENNLYGGTGAAQTYGVFDQGTGIADAASEIRDNTIDGGDPSGGGATISTGVKSSTGAITLIYDNTITGGTGASAFGIWVDPADADIARNIINCEGSATTNICAGIYVLTSTLTNPIKANSINEFATSGINALGVSTRGIWMDVRSSATILGHNPSIYGGEGTSTSYGILVENASTANVGDALDTPGGRNNINGGGCNLGATFDSFGIKSSSGSAVNSWFNTINGGCGTNTSNGFVADPASGDLTANVIVAGDGGTRSAAIFENSTGIVRGNTFDANGALGVDAYGVRILSSGCGMPDLGNSVDPGNNTFIGASGDGRNLSNEQDMVCGTLPAVQNTFDEDPQPRGLWCAPYDSFTDPYDGSRNFQITDPQGYSCIDFGGGVG